MTGREPPAEPPEVRMVKRWQSLVDNGLEGEPGYNVFEDEEPRSRRLYDLRDVEGRPE